MRPASEEEAAAATAERCAWPPLVANWLDLRHQLTALHDVWTWAISTDAAERAARAGLDGIEGGPDGSDWPAVAEALRTLAAQVAEALDRTPVQWRGPAGQVPAAVMAAQTYDNGGALWFTARASQRIEAGQLVAVAVGEEGEYTFLRGWTLGDLVADGGGMLAIDAALVAAGGGVLDAKMAQKRWADFEAGGPIQPVPGAPGAAAFGLTDRDAARLRALWGPYLADAGANGVKGLPILAWRMVKARRAHAARKLDDARHRGPAVIQPVAANLLAMSPQGAFNLGEPTPIATIDGAVFATLADPSARVDLLSTVPGMRLILGLVRRANVAHLAGAHDARAVQYDGGWAALTEAYGRPNRNASAGAKEGSWKDLADAGQALHFEHQGVKYGGLWTYADKRGGPGSPGHVRFVVGDALLPNAVARLPKGNPGRRLVPTLAHDVPVTLDASKHPAIWRAGYGLVLALVERAHTIERDGGVLLDAEAWARIARRAGLALTDLPRVLDAWRAGDDRVPALLAFEGPDVVRLANDHADQWAFIAEGGARRAKGRASGRASAAARQSDAPPKRRRK